MSAHVSDAGVTRAQAHAEGCSACAAHPNESCTQPTDTGRVKVPWVHLVREADAAERLRTAREAARD